MSAKGNLGVNGVLLTELLQSLLFLSVANGDVIGSQVRKKLVLKLVLNSLWHVMISVIRGCRDGAVVRAVPN